MGQETQTTSHIGLGNPMWERESNPGPREFTRGSGPGGRSLGPGWPGQMCWQFDGQMCWHV